MGIAGIGSALSAAAPQYDFTSLTSQEAFDAAKSLFSQGKLTADAAGRLEGAAQGIDYAPVNASQQGSTAHTLADPTKTNWIAYIQQSSDWLHANHATGSESTDALLTELKSYQSTSLAESTKTISTLA